MHYLDYYIRKEEEGSEVLAILRGELYLTTRKIRSVKQEERGILLDGVRVTVRQKVKEGQHLQVLLDDPHAEHRIVSTEMELSILYEDEDLIFLNKPSGIVSHPSLGHARDSLANGVAHYLSEAGKCGAGIHLIGRLDKDTSGLLGIAKNSVTKERMIRFREEGKIRKEYLALVQGIPREKEGIINHPMEEYRDEQDGFKLKMRKPLGEERALSAVTHYRVLQEKGYYSLIQLWLETGRMHQIRFHMASIGHPLLGDTIYGGEDTLVGDLQRTALHAWKVKFPHPYTGKEMELIADVPMDLRNKMNM